MNLIYEKMSDKAIVPSRDVGNNGFDLSVVADEQFFRGTFLFRKGTRKMFKTDLKIQLPERHYALVRPRSGLANKYGIHILGGLVDESYRGEWKLILLNTGAEDLVVNDGDRIAQFVVVKDDDYQLVEGIVDETNRGEKGFGSSGV